MNTNRAPDAGLREAFERHAPRLQAYARRLAGADAEDLVSEAFLVAWRRRDDLPDAEHLLFAWLVATVRRLAANQRRRTATRDEHWRAAVREYWHLSPASPEEAVAEREEALAALGELSETDRELLLLLAWEGLTPEQAGEVLGITRTTLAVRLHRARRRLADHTNPGPALRAVTAKD